MKESINNSLKYAECKNIKVVIKLINNKLTVLIEDDGKGFDTAISSEGYGLRNIFYRAGEIGYKAEFISTLGKGISIRLSKT